MKRIIFHDLAKNELFDARDYYDELAFGLGRIFISEIEKSLNIIKSNPLAYPAISKNIRKAIIIKFSYSILYIVKRDYVFILAVMHQKRKPNYWLDRQ